MVHGMEGALARYPAHTGTICRERSPGEVAPVR